MSVLGTFVGVDLTAAPIGSVPRTPPGRARQTHPSRPYQNIRPRYPDQTARSEPNTFLDSCHVQIKHLGRSTEIYPQIGRPEKEPTYSGAAINPRRPSPPHPLSPSAATPLPPPELVRVFSFFGGEISRGGTMLVYQDKLSGSSPRHSVFPPSFRVF